MFICAKCGETIHAGLTEQDCEQCLLRRNVEKIKNEGLRPAETIVSYERFQKMKQDGLFNAHLEIGEKYGE